MLEGFLLKFLTSFFYNVKNTLHPPLLPLPSCRYTALCLLVSNYGLIAKGDSDASVWGMFSAADYYTFGARAGAVFILRLTRGAYFYGNEGTLHPVQRRRLINVLLIVEQWIFARMGISIVWLWLRREFQGPACFVGTSYRKDLVRDCRHGYVFSLFFIFRVETPCRWEEKQKGHMLTT